jgi:signal transduction histidine kinase
MLGNAVYAVVKAANKREQYNQYNPEVTLAVIVDEGQYILKIRDNGIGIEKKILDKIFDPFFTTKTTSEAAGIGLYLSREIIQNHDGDINVESVKDEYTEFTITLPIISVPLKWDKFKY